MTVDITVLGARSRFRARVVALAQSPARESVSEEEPRLCRPDRRSKLARRRWLPWSWLLHRVFDVEGWACPSCGQRMVLRSVTVYPPATTKILRCLSSRAPPAEVSHGVSPWLGMAGRGWRGPVRCGSRLGCQRKPGWSASVCPPGASAGRLNAGRMNACAERCCRERGLCFLSSGQLHLPLGLVLPVASRLRSPPPFGLAQGVSTASITWIIPEFSTRLSTEMIRASSMVTGSVQLPAMVANDVQEL
jgi:hypothetical protein